jgi:polysaccharide pyruvyl transferase WcaK-like protein
MEALSKEYARSLRIGLISPYTGSNLGDAAIIESARTHLMKLFPKAEVVLIVIQGERVSKLHGMDTFPLTAIPRPFYFTPVAEGQVSPVRQTTHHTLGASPRSGVKWVLKRSIGFIPGALSAIRSLRAGLKAMKLETGHITRVRKMAGNLDGLIIAGGGQFDDEYGGPWGHPYAMFKWVSTACKADVPVYFAGVGVCEILYKISARFLRSSLKKANRVSLRDAGSIEILRKFDVHRELIFCPDLAFGLPFMGDNGERPSPSTIRPAIGLSPIAFSLPGSWPTAEREVFDRYWKEFVNLAVSLLKANYSLKLFSTDDVDFPLAKRLFEQLTGEGADTEHVQLLPLLSLDDLLRELRTCDAVIASRLHGVLLSHLSGAPVLAICYHRKVQAHMEDMEQKGFCIDFGTFTASDAMHSLNVLFTQRRALISNIKVACLERYGAVEREFATIGAELASRTRLAHGR